MDQCRRSIPLSPCAPRAVVCRCSWSIPLAGMSSAISISSSHLPVDQPVYALQAAGAEPGATPLRTMSELAASYIEAIRRVRPDGPYHIGGWSFGGYVAVEMARQLDDEELAQLILLDTTAMGDGPRSEITETTWSTGFSENCCWSRTA